MAVIINRPLAIAIAAETKTGKSTIGAKIAHKYGGVVCDFSRINQTGGMGVDVHYDCLVSAPKQVGEDTIIEVGEAWTACKKVGLDLDKYYKVIMNWNDFKAVIEYARALNSITKKRQWLIIDDTVALRWHKVIEIQEKLGHKSIYLSDWGVAATELKLLVSNLSREFNLFLINQMVDEFQQNGEEQKGNKKVKIKEKTGNRIPFWIPNGADYLIDGMCHIEIDRSNRPYKQYIIVDGGREIWICGNDFNPRVDQVSPENIFQALGITDDRL
jgi:hypothetical protein